MEHVLRSCAIATRFAERLGVSDEERASTYWVTLFVTVGCTGTSYELSQLFGDDIAVRQGLYDLDQGALAGFRFMMSRAGSDRNLAGRTRVRAELLASRFSAVVEAVLAHCQVSGRIAERVGLGPSVVTALEQAYTQWDGKGIPSGVGGEDIALSTRICTIADLMEVQHREYGVDRTLEMTRRHRGSVFDPELVDAWQGCAAEVLSGVGEQSSWEEVIGSQPGARKALTEAELEEALELLADYADLKSPWFTGHSRGVSALAEAAASHLGLPQQDVDTVRRAALVHDLGRNGIPNSIWDKPGPLTAPELEKVRLHSYYTDRVLRRGGRLAALAPVASAAHERSDGSGYPRAVSGSTIPLLGRVLEAADCYHAMREDRPHRSPLSGRQASIELRRMARDGELDGIAVDAVLQAAGHAPRARPSAPAGLSPREVEVLIVAARGATTRQVASALGISPKTAGNHIERIYAKIGVSSRAEAAMFAMRHGLVALAEEPQS